MVGEVNKLGDVNNLGEEIEKGSLKNFPSKDTAPNPEPGQEVEKEMKGSFDVKS